MGDPGPKMFPNAVCIAILILSVIIMVQSVFKSEKPFKGALSTPEGKQGCTRMILVLSDLVAFSNPLEICAVSGGRGIFIFLLCMVFREKLPFSIIYSAAVTGALYFVFTILLKVNLNIC